MNIRCAHFWLRGVFFRYPAPFNRDFRCWQSGQSFTVGFVAACIPVALVAAGFAAGRWL